MPNLIQSGGVIHDIPIFGSTLSNLATKRIDLRKYFLHKQVDKFNKKHNRSRITITNNEIKDFMKIIKHLENRGILLKGTTRKIN